MRGTWSIKEKLAHGEKMVELREDDITFQAIGDQYGCGVNLVVKCIKLVLKERHGEEKAKEIYKIMGRKKYL
jgi:hypothetical protein